MAAFSIVITTTRPKLVGFAVHSALAQDFGDFEIVVSDNSDEGCKDVIDGFADPRIKYVRRSKYMGIVDHWNFAFSHASGDWQMLLCDDHAYVPSLLSILTREIERHGNVDTFFWAVATYYDGEWCIKKERFRFLLPSFSSVREVITSESVVKEMFESGTGFAGGVKRKVPLIPRAIYSKNIIDRIRNRFGGHVFEPICPMTSAALAALVLSTKTLRIDLPLSIVGTPNNSAAGHIADASTFNRMHQGVKFKYVPLKSMAVFPATAAETILHVQNLMSKELGHLKIDWVNFFKACNIAIRELQDQGRDSSYEASLYEEALSTFPPEVRERVSSAQIASPLSLFGRSIGKLKRRASRLGRTIRGDRSFPSGILDTRHHRLNDILDCAEFLERLIERYEIIPGVDTIGTGTGFVN